MKEGEVNGWLCMLKELEKSISDACGVGRQSVRESKIGQEDKKSNTLKSDSKSNVFFFLSTLVVSKELR